MKPILQRINILSLLWTNSKYTNQIDCQTKKKSYLKEKKKTRRRRTNLDHNKNSLTKKLKLQI